MVVRKIFLSVEGANLGGEKLFYMQSCGVYGFAGISGR